MLLIPSTYYLDTLTVLMPLRQGLEETFEALE